MLRLLQIIRSASIIITARLTDKYAWQQTIVDQCEELGGVYVKFIQMLAVHESTKHWVKGASTDQAYEQVTYEPIDVARELGKQRVHFASYETQPFAAGSYGQVYRATLLDGTAVILKILRPTVRKTLRTDLRILNTLAVVLGWFSSVSIVDIKAMCEEFSGITMLETDYKREASSGEWLRDYFNKRQTLFIPKSYRELGSKHILVQQYVEGISLAQAMSLQREGGQIDQIVYQATGSDVWQQMATLGLETLNASLYGDHQMVDIHPGNVRFMTNNRVALIDFGMMSDAPRNRAAIVNMVGEYVKIYENRFQPGSFAVAMLALFDMELHDALQVVARQRDSDYMQTLESFIQQYVQTQAGDSLTQHYLVDRQMYKLFNEVINRGNKLGLRISRENVMLQRSLNMLLSIMRQIGEAHDGQIHFVLLHQVMKQAYDDAVKNGFDQEMQADMSEERAFEVTANWLSVVAEKDRELYRFIMKRSFA